MPCINVCGQYESFMRLYTPENKRCIVCNVMMKWAGKFCPCCGRCLRNKPRRGTLRKIFEEKYNCRAKSQ